ncbi:MAG: M23 family metallopeptidase [Anaerolineaceae bacterium]|nr:M23 family metallopeptidase [Anaerolineaceae bacterium]
MKKLWMMILGGIILGGIAVGLLQGSPQKLASILTRSKLLREYLEHPDEHTEWAHSAGDRCGDAPFLIPTSGMIGYLWDDSFRLGHRHQGIDIFGGGEVGLTPVIAAYDGYLTRLPEWKSTVIISVPSDPLHPGEQIWTYYTHMADAAGNSLIAAEFSPGTDEQFVKAGTVLGYQGNYSGDPDHPVGIHLHFSIVKSDMDGLYKNELKIENTLDPSPYLGLSLNRSGVDRGYIPVCP